MTRSRYQLPVSKAVLAGAIATFGISALLMSFAAKTFGEWLGTALLGWALILPSAWWFLHERKRKANPDAPAMKRHWGIITVLTIGLMALGSSLMPETQDTDRTFPPGESSTATTSEGTSSAGLTTSTTAMTSTATPSVTETFTPVPEAEVTPDVVVPDFTPEPLPAPEPEPAPTLQQEAPAPQYFAPPPAPADNIVHPGAFCTGGTGVSKTGKQMVCAEAKDGRLRWQSA